MRVTVSSVGMALFWGSLFVVLLHGFRRRFPRMRGRTPSFFLALYLLCALRMVVPVEFVTLSNVIWLRLPDGIGKGLAQLHVSSGIQHQFMPLLLTLWFAVAGVLMVLFLFRYNRAVHSLFRHAVPSLEGERLLQRLQQQYSRKTAVSVFLCPGVKIPMGAGLFHRRILLPCVPLGGGRRKPSFLMERFHWVMEESVPKKKAKGWILGVLVGALLAVSYFLVPQAATARADDQSPEWTIAIGAAGENTKDKGFLVTQLSQEQVLQWAQETGWEVAFQDGVLESSLYKTE